ncbi:MAG TPA: hypothetical protein VM580_04050 [Labilithrix sp.]|nr:hypothetical protein [Labilithrix sp.]
MVHHPRRSFNEDVRALSIKKSRSTVSSPIFFSVKLVEDAFTGHWAYDLGSASNDAVTGLSVSMTTGRTAVVGSLSGNATLAGTNITNLPAGAATGYILVLDP